MKEWSSVLEVVCCIHFRSETIAFAIFLVATIHGFGNQGVGVRRLGVLFIIPSNTLAGLFFPVLGTLTSAVLRF